MRAVRLAHPGGRGHGRPGLRPDVRGRGARVPRGQAGRPVRRPGRKGAGAAAPDDRPLAPGASTSPTCSSAARRGTAIRSPRRSRRARATSSPRSSSSARRSSARSATSRRSSSRASPTASPASTASRSRCRIGGVDLVLYPIFHPAAALYTPAMMTTLEGDFARLPELLSGPVAAPPAPGCGRRRSRSRARASLRARARVRPAGSLLTSPTPSGSPPRSPGSFARRTSSMSSASWERGRPRSCAPPAPRSA